MAEKGIEAEAVVGAGMGVPGAVLHDRYVDPCVNLNGWGGNVADALSELCHFPVKAATDANAAALGEMWRGGGKGCDNVVLVTLGTGVGGGIIVDGKVSIDQERCVGCGICASRCTVEAITIKQTMPMREDLQTYFATDYNLHLKL